jgi:hypothetical protein
MMIVDTAGTPDHVADLLPAYINRTLDPETQERVERHLGECGSCQSDLEDWRLIARLTLEVTSPAVLPTPLVMGRIWSAIDLDIVTGPRPSLRASAAHARQVLVGQLPLIQRYLWPGSTFVMGLGFVIAALGRPGASGLVIQLIAPIVAAIGMTLIYGPEIDPSLEVALATPTSPRLILLARLTLVFGFDLLLTLAAMAGLVPLGRGGPASTLSFEWLGPMLFLSGLALVLSLRFGPTVAMSTALILWTIRVFVAMDGGQGWLSSQETDLIIQVWSTNVLTLVGAAILTVLALGSINRQERLA